jgi:hypothetical protein
VLAVVFFFVVRYIVAFKIKLLIFTAVKVVFVFWPLGNVIVPLVVYILIYLCSFHKNNFSEKTKKQKKYAILKKVNGQLCNGHFINNGLITIDQ